MDFKESIRPHAIYGDAHYGLGCMAEEEGVCEMAVTHFTDAIRNEPGVGYDVLDRASARRELGQHKMAKRDLERALEFAPTIKSDYQRLAEEHSGHVESEG